MKNYCELVEAERLRFASGFSIDELYALRRSGGLKPVVRLGLEREIARREYLDKRFKQIDEEWDKKR